MAKIDNIPMAPSVPSTYSSTFEQTGREFTNQQRETLQKIRGGLQTANSTLPDGRQIANDFDTICWLLSNVTP